jgi:hypothetical protein
VEVEVQDCMRCGNPWPASHSRCPMCNWDGKDLAFTMPMPWPEICS